MRRNLTIIAAVTALATVGTACHSNRVELPSVPPTGGGSAVGTASGATGGTGTTINPSGSLPPTSSPGITGAVNMGSASVTTSGQVNTQVTFATLGTPAIWSPPPGAIALVWTGASRQSLGLGGDSFTAAQPTSAAHSLAITLRVNHALVAFRSVKGECTVTISPALPDNVGGTFLCTNLPDVNGTMTINAQGTFSAEG